MKQVKVNDNVNELLEAITKKRQDNGELNSTKQAVVHELIMAAYKKEMK